MEKWKKLGRILKFHGKVIDVFEEKLELPDGKKVDYEFVKCKGGACALSIDDNENVILIRQYRNTLDAIAYELPGGCFDFPGEDALICAKRELLEETGISAEKWTFYSNCITAIGMTDERVSIFFAENLSKGLSQQDPEERIDIVEIPFAKALDMIENGEIVDAKTIIALQGYFYIKNREKSNI